MNPDEFLGGKSFTTSADDFTKGGFKVVTPETGADAPTPDSSNHGTGLGGFLKGIYNGFQKGMENTAEFVGNAEIGAAKGAASTLSTVVKSVGGVVGQAQAVSSQKQFNETRDKINKTNDQLLLKIHSLAPGDPQRQKYIDLIKSNNQTFQDLNNSEKDVMSSIDDTTKSFTDKPDFLKPKGTGQKIGYGAERIAEFLVPGSAVKKGETALKSSLASTSLAPGWQKAARVLLGSGLEGLSTGTVTAAQGGDLNDVENATFWGSILSVPFKALSVYGEGAGKLAKDSAEKSASQALGATGKGDKAISDKVVPGLIDKRVRFVTRAGLESKAGASADEVGAQIGEAWDKLPPDTKVVVTPMMERLEAAKSALTIKGTSQVPEAAQSQYQALQNIQKEILGLTGKGPELETVSHTIASHIDEAMDAMKAPETADMVTKDLPGFFAQTKKNIVDGLIHDGYKDIAGKIDATDLSAVTSLDDFKKAVSSSLFDTADISAESVRSFRSILDTIIKPKAKGIFGMTGDESAKLAAQKEGANAMRNALNDQFPDIAKLNKEYNFWKNVQTVVGNTVNRTKSQATPLAETMAEGAGAVVGAVKGGKTLDVILGATGLRLLQKVITSPAFKMASAIAKDDLGNALMSESTPKIISVLNRLLAGEVFKPETNNQ